VWSTSHICIEAKENARQLKDSSIGVKSREYGGKYAIIQPGTGQTTDVTAYMHRLTTIVYKIDEKIIVMNPTIVKDQD
jgi:tRNA A58 N-methylase Trm61